MTPRPKRLLDQVRDAIRVKHCFHFTFVLQVDMPRLKGTILGIVAEASPRFRRGYMIIGYRAGPTGRKGGRSEIRGCASRCQEYPWDGRRRAGGVRF